MASNAKRAGCRKMPWRVLGWGIAAVLLLLPLIAMQFTTEVNWTASDFVFAAIVFGLVGGTFELAVRKSGNLWYRGGVAMALATAFLLVWINGAVGIIGDEGNPANLMFLAVIAIAGAGAVVARFEAAGMARAMAMAAVAEGVVGLITLFYRLGANEPPFFPGVPMLIGFFALAWLLSAWLFAKAASERASSETGGVQG
jgi:hypothetical protein